MEPQWTKKISSKTVCQTYYVIFWLYAFIAILALVGTVFILLAYKLPKGLAISVGFQGLLTASIGAILALFQYLVCSRALLGDVVLQKK